MELHKGDKVRIINTGDIWEGRIGKVYEVDSEEILTVDGHDLTSIDVALTIDTNQGEKTMIKDFHRENLEAVAEEALNENTIQETLEGDIPSFDKVEDFESFFEGKKAVFKGFDYRDFYNFREQENGEFDFEEEDKEEIESFKSHEGKRCTITACAVADGFEPEFIQSTEESFESCYWDVKFDDDEKEFFAISGLHLDVDCGLNESLISHGSEEIEYYIPNKKHKEDDIIEPFVYRDFGDEELVPTWCFLNTIAAHYGTDEETIFNFCKEYGHKVWCIRGATIRPKFIVAAKEIKSEDILDGYAIYIDGARGSTIEEVELK